ncbi:hypothetical protein [Nocardia africana]|uniref:Lipopolysaccharide assembly protein A domain-containing protein n=1 Tax=Nocardia africana TaxID=134964 RepID=A0A378WQF2_9NOCA|nr:hypothetical protein [Nocardia africana]MCC3314167.1 hypothetical protein [Nocardia africana]SUA43580.1 Uncharacterised protein [Nocardia africana]
MIVFIGLIILFAALVVGIAAALANSGDTHVLASEFTVFGAHFTPTQNELFAAGAAVGAVGMLGLGIVLSGAFSSARRHAEIRRELRHSRREMSATRKDLAKTPPAQPVVAETARPAATPKPRLRNPFTRRGTGMSGTAQPQP